MVNSSLAPDTDALSTFWYVRGYFGEARGWFTGLLAAGTDAPTASRAKALRGAGLMAWRQGDYPAARRFHEECLAIQRELGDQRMIAGSLLNLGAVYFEQGDYEAARARFEEGLAIRRQLGGEVGIADAVQNLGAVAKACGNNRTAWELFEEGLRIYRALGDRFGISIALINLGSLAFERGDHIVARALNEEGLTIRRELGDRRGIAESLDEMACFAVSQPGRAARIWGAAQRLREEVGAPPSPVDRADRDLRVSAARTAMADDAAFELALLEGRMMTLEQAIDYALAKHDT
jgi:tetratricopeptide (TPR) repeat protein